MDITQELKNYQEFGANLTLSGLKAQKKQIEESQHIVSVLEVISQLNKLVETAKFKSLDIKLIELYPGEEEWDENKFEINLLNAQGIIYDKSDQRVIKTLIKINQILDLIETGEKFMGETKNVITVSCTPTGLKELQNYFLSPALQISLEKAILAQAVRGPTQTKKEPILKI